MDENNDDLVVLSPNWLCTDMIGRFLAYERISQVPTSGRLSVEYVRSIFPRCDIGAVTRLFESLEISSRTVIDNITEYDVPSIAILERPKALWEQEDNEAKTFSSPDMDVWGGVQICAPEGMEEQLICVFPRVQTNFRMQLVNWPGNYVIYNWRLGTKIKYGNLAIVVELKQESMAIEVNTRTRYDQRVLAFHLQEDVCTIIMSVVNGCCPGLYLERRPISVVSLRERRKQSAVFTPRQIHLARIDSRSTIQVLEPNAAVEQLVDVVAFGSQEIYDCLTPGMDIHISHLALYTRFILASLLDPKHPLGRDWCMLGVVLGLADQIASLSESEAMPILSMTDALLGIWSKTSNATFLELYEKLMRLDRDDAVGAMLSLTPLYQFVPTVSLQTQLYNQVIKAPANSSVVSPSNPGSSTTRRNSKPTNHVDQSQGDIVTIQSGPIFQSNITKNVSPGQPAESWVELSHKPNSVSADAKSIEISGMKEAEEETCFSNKVKSINNNDEQVQQRNQSRDKDHQLSGNIGSPILEQLSQNAVSAPLETESHNVLSDFQEPISRDVVSSPLEPLSGLDEITTDQDTLPELGAEKEPHHTSYSKEQSAIIVPPLNLPNSENESESELSDSALPETRLDLENISKRSQNDDPDSLGQTDFIDNGSDESQQNSLSDVVLEEKPNLAESGDDVQEVILVNHVPISSEVETYNSVVVASTVSVGVTSSKDSDDDTIDSPTPDVFSPVTPGFDSNSMDFVESPRE